MQKIQLLTTIKGRNLFFIKEAFYVNFSFVLIHNMLHFELFGYQNEIGLYPIKKLQITS
jgi:hypothetical protein